MPSPPPDPAVPRVLQVHRLTVSYGAVRAVDDVSFRLAPAALTGLIGPNGAGKSTLVKALVGLEEADRGEILFGSRPLRDRRPLAYVPQRSGIDLTFPITVHETALLGTVADLARFGRPRRSHRDWADHCLDLVGMVELRNRRLDELSGGQAQRVLIARALAQRPELFVLDEPFVGIDMASEERILQVLREQRDAGRAVLVVHHDLNQVPEYFDELLVLNRHLVAAGPTVAAFTRENISAAFDHPLRLWRRVEPVR